MDIALYVEKHHIGDIDLTKTLHSTYRLNYVLKLNKHQVTLTSHELDMLVDVLLPHKGKEMLTVEY